MQAITGFMGLGQTLKGTADDGTTEINQDKVGTIMRFPSFPSASQRRGSRDRPASGGELTAVLLRNRSALTLLGKRLAVVSLTAGYAGIQEVTGYNPTRANPNVVLIDPFLDSNGVANLDLFWGIIGGPALVLLPLTGAGFAGADIAVGDAIVATTGTTSGVTTSGRIGGVTVANATDAVGAYNAGMAFLGRALSARTTAETTAGNDLLVQWNIKAFPAG